MSRMDHLFVGEAVRTGLDWSLAMMGIAYWTSQYDGGHWSGQDEPRQCHQYPAAPRSHHPTDEEKINGL